MSRATNHYYISEILSKVKFKQAEAEIEAAEKDILQWKISKINRNSSQAINDVDTDVTSKIKSNENSLSLVKHSISTDTLNGIEKRIRDLEISREVECGEHLKKIHKLEKIVGKIAKNEKSPRKINFDAGISRKNRTKSTGYLKKEVKPKKNVRYCVWVKDLENDVEKWKHRAQILQQKCFIEIKELRKQLIEVKTEVKKESKDLKSTYMTLLKETLEKQ
jgi:hypothetical protein